jgi:hypothetical protein
MVTNPEYLIIFTNFFSVGVLHDAIFIMVVKFKFIKWLYTARLKALGIPEFHICTCTMTEHKVRLTHMPNMIKIKKHNTN